MSHISKVALEIKDLPAFIRAAERAGMEFLRDVKTFRYYHTRSGKCDHALRVKGNAQAWEMGVRQDDKGNWTLVGDFFLGGEGLCKVVGDRGEVLKKLYAAEVAKTVAKRKGFTVQERWSSGRPGFGTCELVATKR